VISSARRQKVAARLGLLGGALGVVAGTVQVFSGSRIPDWSGAKANPVGLGLLTVLLSVLAIVSSQTLRGSQPASPQRRVAGLAGVLVPATLCFSTVGRLWYVPGGMLLLAAATILGSGSGNQLWQVVRENWLRTLISALGGFQLLMAVSAAPAAIVAVGIVTGLVLVAAPWVREGRRTRLLLILLGALPFAALTWWSLATPLLAVLAVSIALASVGGRKQDAPAVRPPMRVGQP